MEDSRIANILIVDDKPENLTALASLLASPSLNIVKARSGNEALGKLLEQSFACVLLDINMPDIDGFEVVRIMREDEGIKHVPVLFVTAFQRTDDAISKGYQYGAVDFLFKPLQPDIVRSKVGVFAELYRKRQMVLDQRTELEQMNQELSASNRELERFAYIASHDLQEPLRTISNYVALMGDKLKDKLDGDLRKYMSFVSDASKRMQILIKAILDLSQAGNSIGKIEPVDCTVVMANTLSILAVAIKESGANVTGRDLPVVLGDAALLGQLFQNLLANAVKYRNPNVQPEIQVTAEKRGDDWVFTFSDNGIGIDVRHAHRIFDPFFRLHGHEIAGAGIGLATCKKIVEKLGGRIWLESSLGRGCTFQFSLPIRPIATKPA